MRFCCFQVNTDLVIELWFYLVLEMAGSGRKTTVLLIYMRLCYSSTQSFHTINKCKQWYLCSHSHGPKRKLFAKTTHSPKSLMGQGQILPAWWPLLSCKYLAEFALGRFCNPQEGAKNERDIQRDRSRAQQVCAMFSQGAVVSAHRYYLQMQFAISVLCLPCIPVS